ncbi:MAG: MFS transporter [Candidatus Limnocylindrales bacterium]
MERQLAEARARNYALVQVDSVFVGLVAVAGTFLPVFLIRLGASGTEVGLLTSLPALTAFLLAIPAGRWLQRRRNIVPWYSRLRLAAWLGYAGIALAVQALPASAAVPAVLAVWAAASLPSTAALVAFPVVMDGAAGPRGRFDLLGRRWAIAGVATTAGVLVAGQALGMLPFPANFELLLGGCALAAVASFGVSRGIVIPDQIVARDGPRVAIRAQLGGFVQLIRGRATFLAYELRAFVFTVGIGLAVPLLPLLYVNEIAAPNWWIGVVGAAQSVGAVAGYLTARRVSHRRGAAAVLLPSMLVAGLAPAIVALLHALPVVAAMALVSGLAMAGTQLGLFNELMKRVPRKHGVTFSSVDQTLQNLALIVAPSMGGLLAVTIGVRSGLAVASAVALLGFGMFLLDWRGGTAATT